jgi:hypothetical protein
LPNKKNIETELKSQVNKTPHPIPGCKKIKGYRVFGHAAILSESVVIEKGGVIYSIGQRQQGLASGSLI